MHENFSKWYADVSMGDDDSRRETRWESVKKLASSIAYKDLETLFQLCLGGRLTPSADVISQLYAPFVESDPAFDIAENKREVKVLAGAVLVVLMQDLEAELGGEAALGATTTAMFGKRAMDLPQHLATLGEQAVRRRAEENRRRPKVYSGQDGLQVKVNVEEVQQRLSQGFDQNSVAEELAKLGTLVQSRLATIVRRHGSAMQSLEHFLEIQDEEMEMLWWVIGEYSRSYSSVFSKVAAKARPIIFSVELAEMTKVLPGPISIAALLSRTGLTAGRKTEVVQVVNAVREDWLRERVSTRLSSPVTTPLHEAVKRRLETGEDEAWVAGWAAVTGLSASLGLTPLDIAMQFYREALYMMDS